MSIKHKFQYVDWKNGFYTENSILKTNLYKPEVLFLGTFNPNTPNDNHADFFYGRNWFWPAFKNLFIENDLVNLNRRMPSNGAPIYPLNPSLNEIFSICEKGKLSFADLINSVIPNSNNYIIQANDNIVFNNSEYNLINDNVRNNQLGLAELDNINQVEWNVLNIINYLGENPQIKHIYITRKPTGIWKEKWIEIKNAQVSKGRNFEVIYTPSAANLKGNPRLSMLIKHWLFNENTNYSRLNNEWLIRNGVNLNNF
jgi:hypothetical protein